MVWSSSTPARRPTWSFIDGEPPVRNRVVPHVGQKWLLISCPSVINMISIQYPDILRDMNDTYVPVVRLLRVHLRLSLSHRKILLRDLVHCEIVDLAIIVTVAHRLANIGYFSNLQCCKTASGALCTLATHRVSRASGVCDPYLAAQTASRRHFEVETGLEQVTSMSLEKASWLISKTRTKLLQCLTFSAIRRAGTSSR